MSIFQRSGDLSNFYRTSKVTSILIVLVSFIFLFLRFSAAFQAIGIPVNKMFFYGLLIPDYVLEFQEYWRLITYSFMHYDFMHYLMNTFMGLYILGSAFERKYGSLKFVAVYFFSVLTSGLLITFIASPAFPLDIQSGTILHYILGTPGTPVLGASGGLYGLLGAFLYVALYKPEEMMKRDRDFVFGILAINVVFTLLAPSVSFLGHAGGLIGGFLISFLLIKRKKPDNDYDIIDFTQ